MRVEVRDPDYSAEMSGRLTKLENAISKQRTIRFHYWTISRDETAERSVNPLALFHEREAWYLIGLDLDRRRAREDLPRVPRSAATSASRRGASVTSGRPEDFDPPPTAVARPGSSARSSARPRSSSIPTPRGGSSGRSSEARSRRRLPDRVRATSAASPRGSSARKDAPGRVKPRALVDEVRRSIAAVVEGHTGEPPRPAREVAVRDGGPPVERPAGPGRARALRRPPGAARVPPRPLRRRAPGRHPGRGGLGAVQA